MGEMMDTLLRGLPIMRASEKSHGTMRYCCGFTAFIVARGGEFHTKSSRMNRLQWAVKK